ncbi:ABC transporter substrate-binding protein [Streptococcus danieliae]|uniref:ABC transporter substrate-binding protein n=1 Tax=Streptococcus danieliae TaxID=747656 RepID=A0A7Z0S5H0_9STRE|nr:ABC transporter substrate-binding protein [Streptococcus danieliae]MBF0699891.1 ABC transporter substrate-binding protein [Streptococcus danieliae]NYS97067.1 ABC transporter substrate-binding protein [Streptococcus danieliae]
MKRLISFVAGIGLILLTLGAIIWQLQPKESQGQKRPLVIYNWGDYIDPELIKRFTEETGIRIQYETFDSNEAMYTKVKQGGTTYDLVIPSEYMIQKMIQEGLAEKLDHSKITGLEHIDPSLLDQSFDPKNAYSIPYFWGTLGIVYNDQLIDQAPQHWADLWNPAYKNQIMLIDGAREVMGLSLNSLGYSINSQKQKELNQATDHLYKLTPNIKAIVADEMKNYMIQNNAGIGVTFSGEARQMLDENEHLHYVVPPEGSNLWFDNIVIPHTVKNREAAYAFINFMLQPDVALQNAEYIGYSTPNLTAQAELPDEMRLDQAFYPTEEAKQNLEVYQNLGPKWLGIYNDLFLQFKMYPK